MLSVKSIKSGGGAADYYSNLAREDYYAKGGEPPGRYLGAQAEARELTGEVKDGELKAMLAGHDPKTGEVLADNAGDKHKAGWDCTYSAPKSVSVAWGVADPETRKIIESAHNAGVAAGLRELERNGIYTRHGAQGAEHRNLEGGVIAAAYQHSTNRDGEINLHDHVLIANIGPDGRGLDLDTRWKMESGAAYRAEMARELQKAGFEVERDGSSFRLKAMSKELEKDLSSRRQTILKELHERGERGGKAAAKIALETRNDKGEIDRATLYEQTRAIAAERGVDAETIRAMRQTDGIERSEPEPMADHESLLALATEQASTLTEPQLQALVMQEAQGKLSVEEARQYITELKHSEHLVMLTDDKGTTRYTSEELYRIEQRVGTRASEMSLESSHEIKPEALEAAIASRTLSSEQQRALDHITQPNRFAVVEGTAGAGKSYMLDAAREAWQKSGYQVQGCALAGKAAEGLEKSSGMEASTIHSLLGKLDDGKIALNERSVVVVDEGGMCGSRLMARLQDHVDAAGGKLVIVGDTIQLQPIDAGGAMRAQREACDKAGTGHAVMNEIRRQKDESEKALVLAAKAGDSAAVLKHLEDKGRVIEHADRAELAKEMAKATVDDLKNGKTSLAMTETRAEVRRMNEYARTEAKAAGLVKGDDREFATETGIRQFAEGDRLIFLKNDRELGVKNGTTGTVTKAEDGRLIVKIDDTAKRDVNGQIIPGSERAVDVHQDKYAHVDHGYAMTVHKSQGVTVDRAHYAPAAMTHRELAYVALSRHRETVQLHTTSEQRPELEKRMSASQAKGTSADYKRVEKSADQLDRAQARVETTEKRIAQLEDQIAKEKQLSVTSDNKAEVPTTTKEQQDGPERRDEPDRYRGLDTAKLDAARAAAAALSERHDPAHVTGPAAQSVDKLRDVSRLAVVQDHERNAVLLPGDALDKLEARRQADKDLRRQGSGDRETGRRAEQVARLEKQLAAAKTDLKTAHAERDKSREQHAQSVAKAQTNAHQRTSEIQQRQASKPLPVGMSRMPKGEQDKVSRDADLARKALAAHKAGERLPGRKDLDKQIKSGETRVTKDSAGKVFYQNQKTGQTLAKDLNKPKSRETTSRNINHLGLTRTKYMIVDKKIMGVKVGSQVLKSGGTLRSEAAGKLRDSMREGNKNSVVGRVSAKVTGIDYALRKAEHWQKTGTMEALSARVKIALENRKSERTAIKELETKAKSGERLKKDLSAEKNASMQRAKDAAAKDMTPAKATEKTQERAKSEAKANPREEARETAKDLANRPVPDRATEKSSERSPEPTRSPDKSPDHEPDR